MKNFKFNSINCINKTVLLIAIIFILIELPTVNALPDPTKNIIGRAMWEHYWDIKNTPEYYNNLLDRAQYVNADSIYIAWGTCFFIKEMNPALGYTDPLGRTRQTLVDFLANAHKRNITVILTSPANKLTLSGDSGCKGYFGTQYFPKDKNGTNLASTGMNYLDFNYPEARAKRIELIKYSVSNFDFDGVHIEEPGLWLAGSTNTGYGIEWSGRAGILAEHGYDINAYSYPFVDSPANANPVLLDMLHEREKGITLFFKELRESISALGVDYKHPYFQIDTLSYQTGYNPKCVVGANCAVYGLNITDVSKKGYIDLFITEKTFPDKTGVYSLASQKNIIEETIRNTPEIYHTGITYISGANLDGIYLNPLFFDEISAISSIGGSFEIFFAGGYLNYSTYPPLWNRSPTTSSITPYQWLHSNPPKTKRTFNPIGLKIITTNPVDQTIVVGQTATFSVVATGTSLSYQWQKNNVNIPGATSASYNIMAKDLSENNSKFSVIVTNSLGSGMSNSATLTVLSTSTIIDLVKNQGFESGTTSWLFYTSGTGTFSTISPGYNGTKAANISLASNGTNIQLYQTDLILEPNTHYQLGFSAYSTTGHKMNVFLIKHGSPYTNYGLSFTPNLGTNWQTFTTEFNTSGFTGIVNDGRLMFQFGQFAAARDTYYIDDIRLERFEKTYSIYDINNDGVVNIYDMSIVSYHYDEDTTSPYPAYDVNGDGKVDISDLILVGINII